MTLNLISLILLYKEQNNYNGAYTKWGCHSQSSFAPSCSQNRTQLIQILLVLTFLHLIVYAAEHTESMN